MHKIAFTAVVFAVASATSLTSSNLLATNAKQVSFINKPTTQTVKVAEVKKQNTEPAKPAPVMVTVEGGDTLSSIAEAHDTTYVRIYNANEVIMHPDVINPGQELRIPTADETLPDRGLPQAAPIAAPAASTSNYTAPRAIAKVSYPAVSGSDAKAFIYSRESGNNPNATNPNGCYGLGQDCNGRVRALCGADYACQDEYFTSYMAGRYGTWENAVAFWNTHGWW